MVWVARIIVALGALTTGTLGVLFLAMPDTMVSFVELTLTTPLARSDVRTVYGGLELGIAVLTLVWLVRPGGLHAAVMLHLAVWGGLAFGRAVGLALSDAPASAGVGLFAIEIVGLALGVVAWWSLRRHG